MKRFVSVVAVLALLTVVLLTKVATVKADSCPGSADGWIVVNVPEQARDIWDNWTLDESAPITKVCVGGFTFTKEASSTGCIAVHGLGTPHVVINRFCPDLNRFSYLVEAVPTATLLPSATASLPTETKTIVPSATMTPTKLVPIMTQTLLPATNESQVPKEGKNTYITIVVVVLLLGISIALFVWGRKNH